jgi:hypothetical protein
MNDLAFHTLREYAPGDDRRFIHWRSSARAISTGGKFMVRQFQDTRRTQLLIVIDGDRASYRDPEQFELAIRAGASVALRAVQDELDVTLLVADQQVKRGAAGRVTRRMVLDACARAEPTGRGLADLIGDGVRQARDLTYAVVVTGPRLFGEVRRAHRRGAGRAGGRARPGAGQPGVGSHAEPARRPPGVAGKGGRGMSAVRRLVPASGDLVDAAAVAGLGLLTLLGFGNTYEGSRYLVVGAVALGLGVALAHVFTALRLPVVVLAAATLVTYFVAGAVVLGPTGSWLAAFPRLGADVVLSWKQLLTTLPPVPGDSPLIVIPFVLGLLAGVTGFAAAQRLARRVRPGSLSALLRAGLPVLPVTLALGLVLALGTDEPAAKLLNGVVFGVGCLVWTSARLRRLRPPTRTTSRPVRRAAMAAGVLAAAAVASVAVTPLLPGAEAPRAVLRDHVVPPFDLSDYPSPLVGFRKYTEDANLVWDQTLFTVTGLPEGASVRIATLDDYDGMVWGATDGSAFRLGIRVREPRAPQATVQVTIGAAYAAATDVNAWLPEAGLVSRVDFAGPRARELGASLHYNRDLSAGIVTTRLREGDTYTFTTTLADPAMPADAQPYGRPNLAESAQDLLSPNVAEWTEGATGLPGKLEAVADWLRTNGAYTDGGEGESHYLPGHGVGRLAAFLQDPQPAGNDEQYATAYALAASYLGIPARVVLGARPDATGTVRGADVHAWVEVRVADGTWIPIEESEFMPDRSERPDQRPPPTFEEQEGAVVPPPNALHLPKTSTDTSQVEPFAQTSDGPSIWERIWAWLRPVLTWAGPPLLLAGLVVGLILGAKAGRRHRRRHHAVPANRYAGAWQELVDQVRDLAEVRPALRTGAATSGVTRRERAAALDPIGVLPGGTFAGLAAIVDGIVYGDAEPGVAEAEAFWQAVEQSRAELTGGLSRLQRVRVALSLRSLRLHDPLRAPRYFPGPAIATGGAA